MRYNRKLSDVLLILAAAPVVITYAAWKGCSWEDAGKRLFRGADSHPNATPNSYDLQEEKPRKREEIPDNPWIRRIDIFMFLVVLTCLIAAFL